MPHLGHTEGAFWFYCSVLAAGILGFFSGWGNSVAMSAGAAAALVATTLLLLPQFKRVRKPARLGTAMGVLLVVFGLVWLVRVAIIKSSDHASAIPGPSTPHSASRQPPTPAPATPAVAIPYPVRGLPSQPPVVRQLSTNKEAAPLSSRALPKPVSHNHRPKPSVVSPRTLAPAAPVEPKTSKSEVPAGAAAELRELPDVGLRFVYPHTMCVLIVNKSTITVRDARYSVILWNLDREGNNPLPIPTRLLSGDFIRPNEATGPEQLVALPGVAPLVKAGDRLFGFASVSCPDCAKTRNYWIYVKGESGWFAEIPKGFPVYSELIRLLPVIRANPESFTDAIMQADRKAIIDDWQREP
jgi:hypothetical protein